MCYATNARPPLPPISGGAVSVRTKEHVLTAADGNRFAAFTAWAESTGGPGIVVLPDVRGLHAFYQDLAVRFAEAGVHATALDYFGRTAGVGTRDDDFEYMPHVKQIRPETLAADVASAVAYGRSPEGGAATAVFTVGFCFGGRGSFNQSARGHGLSGVIGFYGPVAQRDTGDATAPVLMAKSYECPVLGLFGGADRSITAEDVEAFRRALDSAGVANDLVTYEGAPHSFFDRTFAQYEEECADAWRRILGFIRSNA